MGLTQPDCCAVTGDARARIAHLRVSPISFDLIFGQGTHWRMQPTLARLRF
jgi:hypothetical protein